MAAKPSASEPAAQTATRQQLNQMEQAWNDGAPLIKRWLGEATLGKFSNGQL